MDKHQLKIILEKHVKELCGDEAVVERSQFMSDEFIKIVPTGKFFGPRTIAQLRGAFPADAEFVNNACAHIRWGNIY